MEQDLTARMNTHGGSAIKTLDAMRFESRCVAMSIEKSGVPETYLSRVNELTRMIGELEAALSEYVVEVRE